MLRVARISLAIFILLTAGVLIAKEPPNVVILWPSAGKATIRLSFGKFRQLGGYGTQSSFVSDVTVENVTDKSIPRASFTVYLLDKNKVRIGEGVLQVSDIGPGQQVKVAFQFSSVGVPATLSLNARTDASGVPSSLKTVPIQITSIPAGAKLKVDGEDVGITPKVVRLAVGIHKIEFSKEGYVSGSTPLDISGDELPGGTVSFEMGGLFRDTVELRDGRILLGDLMSVSVSSVVLRVNGKDQTYDRNQVKKIMLAERETVNQPPTTQPVQAAPQ
jgi:PEGA domain